MPALLLILTLAHGPALGGPPAPGYNPVARSVGVPAIDADRSAPITPPIRLARARPSITEGEEGGTEALDAQGARHGYFAPPRDPGRDSRPIRIHPGPHSSARSTRMRC